MQERKETKELFRSVYSRCSFPSFSPVYQLSDSFTISTPSFLQNKDKRMQKGRNGEREGICTAESEEGAKNDDETNHREVKHRLPRRNTEIWSTWSHNFLTASSSLSISLKTKSSGSEPEADDEAAPVIKEDPGREDVPPPAAEENEIRGNDGDDDNDEDEELRLCGCLSRTSMHD